MDTTQTATRPSSNPFRGLDTWLESMLGADMRLIYGVAIPMVVVVDLIVLLALRPTAWLVAILMLVEVAALGLVIFAFMKMLDDDHEQDLADL